MYINILNTFGIDTMHSSGDDWPHWNELYEAEDWISAYVYKYSRCKLQSKEKWGSLRYEYVWPLAYRQNGPIIHLPFPLFHRIIKWHGGEGKLPRYLFYWTNSWLYYKWMKWGNRMLKRAVEKACIKFPNVVTEITEDLE